MGMFRERRRNYYIKKKFQANFIMKFCALVVAGALISGAIVYVMSKNTVTTTFENSRLTIKSTADFILPAVLLSGIVVVIAIGLATAAVALFTSHRIAGPLYRMEKDIQEVIAGNLRIRFNLRQRDELKLLAASLDMMAQSLRARVADMKDNVNALDTITHSMPGMTPALGERIRKLKSILDKFGV